MKAASSRQLGLHFMPLTHARCCAGHRILDIMPWIFRGPILSLLPGPVCLGSIDSPYRGPVAVEMHVIHRKSYPRAKEEFSGKVSATMAANELVVVGCRRWWQRSTASTANAALVRKRNSRGWIISTQSLPYDGSERRIFVMVVVVVVVVVGGGGGKRPWRMRTPNAKAAFA